MGMTELIIDRLYYSLDPEISNGRKGERAVLDGTDKVFSFISRESSELDRGTRHTGFRLTAFSTLFHLFIFFLPLKFFSPWYQRDVFDSNRIIKREIMDRTDRYATINDSNKIKFSFQ